jgi:branched-chain amino acid transport system substrate-binding protein
MVESVMPISRLLPSTLLLSLAAFGCAPKAGPEPVWIGQLLPLDGSNRAIGQRARQGVEQAVAEARAAGQSPGGRPLAVLHVDDHGDAATVRAETVRLLTVNKAVALLADFDSALTERLVRESRPYGVAVVVPGELSGEAESASVRSLALPPAVRGRLLAKYASTDLHLRRAAVLTDSRRPAAAAFAAAFVKAWPNDSGGAVEEWSFTSEAERDERVARLSMASPAVIVLACSVADFRALRPRLASTHPKAPLIHGGEDAGEIPLQAELEASPEVYLATAYSADHLTEAGRAFARAYQERFHEAPDLYAAQAYDAARLLFAALARAGDASKEALEKEVSHLEEFDSVTGPVHWKNGRTLRRVFLLALRKNRAQIVRVVEPEKD